MNTLAANPQLLWAAVALIIATLAAIVTCVVTNHDDFLLEVLGGLAFIAFWVWVFSS